MHDLSHLRAQLFCISRGIGPAGRLRCDPYVRSARLITEVSDTCSVRYDPFRQLDRISGDLLRQPTPPGPAIWMPHGRGPATATHVELRFDLPGRLARLGRRDRRAPGAHACERRALVDRRPRVTTVITPRARRTARSSRQVDARPRLARHRPPRGATSTRRRAHASPSRWPSRPKARKVEIHTGAPELDAVDALRTSGSHDRHTSSDTDPATPRPAPAPPLPVGPRHVGRAHR